MKIYLFLFLAAFTALSGTVTAQATSGSVNFAGKINASLPCRPFFNDSASADGTLTLPTVATSSLAKAGDVAAQTPFTIVMLCDCTPTRCNYIDSTVKAYFEDGATVDKASGRLLNTVASADGGATNVQLQLLDGQSGYSVLPAGSPSSGSAAELDSVLPGDGRFYYASLKTVLKYAVRYYATGASSAGRVASVITYTVAYQ